MTPKQARSSNLGCAFAAAVVLSPLIGIVLFVVSIVQMHHQESSVSYDPYAAHRLPVYGSLGLLLLATPFIFAIFAMWLGMVRNFSPKPFARFVFGAFTLMLFCTGVGWFVNFVLYLWVGDGQPDVVTGHRMAAPASRSEAKVRSTR